MQKKIEIYKLGIYPTKEEGKDELNQTTVEFTADEWKLKVNGIRLRSMVYRILNN